MKKQIICAILIMAMIILALPMGANASIATAGELYSEDFTKPSDAAEGWSPDGWTFEAFGGTNSQESTTTNGVVDDGYILMDRGSYDGAVRITYSSLPNIPSEFTYTIDVKGATGTSGWITANINGYYISATAGGAVEYMSEGGSNTAATFGALDNVWYTYCWQVKGDRMSVYRKERGEGNQYAKLLDNVKIQLRSGHRIYAYVSTNAGSAGIDNIRITEGVFPIESKIEVTDGEGTNKKIRGAMTVSAGTVSPTEPANVMALMTIHDERGKIVDIVSNAISLEFGENTIMLEKEYAAEKFDKMRGGTAKIYLWESFEELEPLTKAYSVKIQ